MNKNKQIQTLKSLHPDIERYLNEDCYCPGEIYEPNGFFFQVFKPEEEASLLGKAVGKNNLYWHEGYTGLYVLCRDKLIEFTLDTASGKVLDSLMMDATENNVQIFKEICMTGHAPKNAKLDEFNKNATNKTLKEILSMADAIMVD